MRTERVLIVEDEEVGRDLLARGLRRCGFEVDTAADGADAIARLDQDFDYVVTDLVMPRGDGESVLQELNRRSHRAQRIVITSFADKERVIAVLNLGADYLLEKPFSAEELVALLRRLGVSRREHSDTLALFFQRRLLGLPLSPRERQIVELVLRGEANKQIARTLGISEQTVKNILSNAYTKLGIQSRGELFHVVFPI